MKPWKITILALTLGMGSPGFAQTTFPVRHDPDGTITNDRAQIRSDRDDLQEDSNQITTDREQIREAEQRHRADVLNGNTGNANADASAIRTDRQQLLQDQHSQATDRAALRDDKQDLREDAHGITDQKGKESHDSARHDTHDASGSGVTYSHYYHPVHGGR